MVHPDKCKHPRAQDAFEILGHAVHELEDEGKLKELMYVFNLARGMFDACCVALYRSAVLHVKSLLPVADRRLGLSTHMSGLTYAYEM